VDSAVPHGYRQNLHEECQRRFDEQKDQGANSGPGQRGISG